MAGYSSLDNSFQINLNTLKKGVYEREWVLDDTFFTSLDQNEILGGEVSAKAKVTPIGHDFMLDIKAEGVVDVICDHCLDPMEQEVSVEEQLLVKLTAVDDDDFIAVNPATGLLELAWLLYELIEVNLPIVHCHRQGECNPFMDELLRTHLTVQEVEPKEINE